MTKDIRALFAHIRELLQKERPDETRSLVANGLPKVPLASFSDIGKELCSIHEAHLDTSRRIVWVTGDVGVALASTVAYPYDLWGKHLFPYHVVKRPSTHWWGYRGSGLKDGHMCPVGLGLPADFKTCNNFVDAPGDDTLIFQDTEGFFCSIDYNGNLVKGSSYGGQYEIR